MRVAIVGAGMAGLACADRLAHAGCAVVLFDKGKRPGGRLSTLVLDDRAWDFGAQYFTARDPRFQARVQQWQASGVVGKWRAHTEDVWVGKPTMANVVAHQCKDHDVRFNAQVRALSRTDGTWDVCGPDWTEGDFDAVVVAVPAEQAATLIGLHDLTIAREAASVRSAPCWTVMIELPHRMLGTPDTFRTSGPIAWCARNASKPGRTGRECWIVQASADWSRDNLEREQADVAADLFRIFSDHVNNAAGTPLFLKAHRWRFALPYGGHGPCFWNEDLRLGACGDWCGGPRIEAAWLSGHVLADRMRDAAGLIENQVFAAQHG